MRDEETELKDKVWNELHDSRVIQDDYELVHSRDNMEIYRLKE